MSNTINKPITIAFDDFSNKIIDLINNSGLPFFIIENTLKECLREVHTASQQQLKMDKESFLKMTEEAEKKTQSEKEGG